MELRHLRYLVAIADAGTFNRAAEELRVAQPALTRQIHDLEKELDVELFDSGARRATLTPAGRACVRLARHVLQDTARAVTRVRLSNSGLAGRVTLCAGPYPVASGFVARLVARMKARYPGIEIGLHEAMGPEQWDLVANGEVDIGIGGAPLPEYATLHAETQFAFPINIAVLHPDHPMANRESVTARDLRDLTYLAIELPDADKTFERIIADLRKHGFPEKRIRRVEGYDAALTQVLAGHGWAMAPEPLARTLHPMAGVRVSDVGVMLRTVRMWRRADKRPIVQTVLTELRRLQEEERDEAVAAKATQPDPSANFVPARLELRHLRSFSKVVKLGSLGRAASALHITQPALSRQMRDLEYDVGVALLERGTRGIEMTAAGESFLADVEGVLSVADQLRKEVRRAQRGTVGRCELVVVPHMAVRRMVGQALAELAESYPELKVSTRDLPSPKHTEALRRSEVDVVLGFAFPIPRNAADGLIRHRVVEDEICAALLARDHPLARRDEISLGDLADVPLLFGARSFFTRFYDTVMQQFKAADVVPRFGEEQNRLASTWSLCAQGLGWTLGWRSHLEEPPPGTVAVRLRDFRLGWGAELVYRQDEARESVLAVIDALAAAATVTSVTRAVVAPGVAVLPALDTAKAAIS